MAADLTPALPDGFVLQDDQGASAPPLPDGFVLQGDNSAPAAPSAPVTTTGVVKAAGQGIREGVEGIAGLPGDVQLLMRKLAPSVGNYIYDKTGISKTLPTTEDVNKWTSQYVPNHDAANKTESAVSNIASFIPYALGGPEDLAANVAKRALLPGAASEAAGYITQGTSLETPARMAGALVAPSGRAAAIAKLDAELPDAKALTQGAGMGYDALRNQPGVISARSNQSWAIPAAQDLTSRNILQRAPQTAEQLASVANGAATPSDLDLVKNQLTDIKNGATPGSAEHTASIAALGALNNHMDSLSQGDLVHTVVNGQLVPKGGGNAADISGYWRDNRANYAAGSRMNEVNTNVQNAIDKAATENSGLNTGNKVRQALLKTDTTGWSPAEEATLNQAMRGTMVQNLIRELSNRAGGGGGIASTAIGMGAGALAGNYADGGTGAAMGATILPMLAGRGLRMVYNNSVRNTANDLSRQLAMRSPMAQGVMSNLAAQGKLPQIPTRNQVWIRNILSQHQAADNAS